MSVRPPQLVRSSDASSRSEDRESDPQDALEQAGARPDAGAPRLSQDLRARHVSMIAIGGIIGAGVFVGSSTAIAQIGPAVVVSYLLAGVVVFLVISTLSRMALAAPQLGSFTEYVRLALGNSTGFVAGWLYWYFWVVVVAIEAIAGAVLLQSWVPLEVWQLGLGLMVVLTAVNLASTRSYGEFEFWFASLKVAAIVVFIAVAGAYLLWEVPAPGNRLGNLYQHDGFAPMGAAAVLAGLTTVIFSMCGAEIVTVAAAESRESGRALARLTTGLVLRILLFYVLAIFLIVCIVPWTQIKPGDSPFALALSRMGIPGAATIMNVIVLTAVLSCLNSGVYITARVAFGLAERGDAPRWLVALNSRRVPVRAILLGSVFGYAAVILSVVSPQRLFSFLVNASGGLMLIIYFLVCIAHFRFPYAAAARAASAGSRSAISDSIAGAAAIAIVIVLGSMAFIDGLQSQLYASLGCLALLCLVQRARLARANRARRHAPGTADVPRPARSEMQ